MPGARESAADHEPARPSPAAELDGLVEPLLVHGLLHLLRLKENRAQTWGGLRHIPPPPDAADLSQTAGQRSLPRLAARRADGDCVGPTGLATGPSPALLARPQPPEPDRGPSGPWTTADAQPAQQHGQRHHSGEFFQEKRPHAHSPPGAGPPNLRIRASVPYPASQPRGPHLPRPLPVAPALPTPNVPTPSARAHPLLLPPTFAPDAPRPPVCKVGPQPLAPGS